MQMALVAQHATYDQTIEHEFAIYGQRSYMSLHPNCKPGGLDMYCNRKALRRINAHEKELSEEQNV